MQTREKEVPQVMVTKKKTITGIVKGHEKKKVHNGGPHGPFQVLF